MDRLMIQCAVNGSPDPDPEAPPEPTLQAPAARRAPLAAELERPAGDAELARKLLGSEPNPS